MSDRRVNVEVRKLTKYPKPPNDTEVDLADQYLKIGSIARDHRAERYGLVNFLLESNDLSQGTKVEQVWVAELMKYSDPILRPFIGENTRLFLNPEPEKGRQSLPPFLLRVGVNSFNTKKVTVSEEGFAFSKSDLLIPIGVERPLGETLRKAMETGQCVDLLAGRSYVWVGEEHAGKKLFRVAFGGIGSRYYEDSVIIGPKQQPNGVGDTYRDGTPINTVYPRRIVQVGQP